MRREWWRFDGGLGGGFRAVCTASGRRCWIWALPWQALGHNRNARPQSRQCAQSGVQDYAVWDDPGRPIAARCPAQPAQSGAPPASTNPGRAIRADVAQAAVTAHCTLHADADLKDWLASSSPMSPSPAPRLLLVRPKRPKGRGCSRVPLHSVPCLRPRKFGKCALETPNAQHGGPWAVS